MKNTTARFELQRRKELESLFEKKRVTKLWRKLVKDQMRGLDVKDLYDYYDFNFHIEARVEEIIERVVTGHYRAEAPLVYKAEKKYGICRHLMIPSPSDALVFQVITDELYPSISKSAPSNRAFYSRDRHQLSLPHEHEEAKSYPWFILWPKFQQEIWKFSQDCKYVVTTDLTNYFDNIGLRELRHVISSISHTKEVYLDLLFSLIEDLSWHPDYLPVAHKGLPTINIEAPRLLAHALLFEVDYLLKERTNNSFVRWMDDINFGIVEKKSAFTILGEINDVLKSRGLALNLAKTDILAQKDAETHFMFKENLHLDQLQKQVSSGKNKTALKKQLVVEFKDHINNCKAKNKDKVTKRYLRLLGDMKITNVLEEVEIIFIRQPGLRESILKYLVKLPFTKKVGEIFITFIEKLAWLEDVALYQITETIIKWSIPKNDKGQWFVDKVKERLKHHSAPFGWFCYIHFLAKYGLPNEVLNAITTSKKYKGRNGFYSRQASAAVSRALKFKLDVVLDSWRTEISHGIGDAASVASNLIQIWHGEFPPTNNRLHYYLFPNKVQSPYPISKFLILFTLATSEFNKGIQSAKPIVLEHVTDEWYLYWLKEANPYWFISDPGEANT